MAANQSKHLHINVYTLVDLLYSTIYLGTTTVWQEASSVMTRYGITCLIHLIINSGLMLRTPVPLSRRQIIISIALYTKSGAGPSLQPPTTPLSLTPISEVSVFLPPHAHGLH